MLGSEIIGFLLLGEAILGNEFSELGVDGDALDSLLWLLLLVLLELFTFWFLLLVGAKKNDIIELFFFLPLVGASTSLAVAEVGDGEEAAANKAESYPLLMMLLLLATFELEPPTPEMLEIECFCPEDDFRWNIIVEIQSLSKLLSRSM